MLKIGDLSRLAQVSVKTLRYYSNLGLLKPEWIDRFTGYRYYAPEQLARLNRILALRDLGFSLEQIGGLLSEWVTAEELRGMLRLRRAELEHSLNEERSRLSRVEARRWSSLWCKDPSRPSGCWRCKEPSRALAGRLSC
jgi:DNA-binding transcriptional MerR regulator